MKTKEVNRFRTRVGVRVKFLLLHSQLAPSDPWYNIDQTSLGRKKYEDAVNTLSYLNFNWIIIPESYH